MRLQLIAAAIAISLAGCASTQAPTAAAANAAQVQASVDAQYEALANDIFKKLQAQNPWASDRLPDMSAEALAKRAAEQQAWLAQLEQVDVTALSRQNQINHRMITYRLKNEIDSYTYNEHYMPLNAEGGFHSNLGFMVRNASFRSFADRSE